MCFEFGALDERIGDRYEQTTKSYQIGNGSWRRGFDGRDGGQYRYLRANRSERRDSLGQPIFQFGHYRRAAGSTQGPARVRRRHQGQTRTILEIHKANLESIGSTLDKVLKVTVFLADVKTEKNAMNKVYAQYFPKEAPARAAVGVQFPDNATRVEIELIAWVP
jgi:hypothetical protein